MTTFAYFFLFCLLGATSAICQIGGTVVFDNLHARVTWLHPVDSNPGPTGTLFSAQLYSSPGWVEDEDYLSPAGDRVQFRRGIVGAGAVESRDTAANLFTGGLVVYEVVVTAVSGGPVNVQMRVWESIYPTYEEAVRTGGLHAKSATIYIPVTGIPEVGGTSPTFLTDLPGFSLPTPPFSILKIISPGLNLVGNPYSYSANASNLFPIPPLGSRLHRFVGSGWSMATYNLNDDGVRAWEGSASLNIRPFEGFFFYNPSDYGYAAFFRTNDPIVPASIPLPAGLTLLSAPVVPRYIPNSPLPHQGLPIIPGTSLFLYRPATGTYDQSTYDHNIFGTTNWNLPERITPAQGYWFYSPQPGTWNWN